VRLTLEEEAKLRGRGHIIDDLHGIKKDRKAKVLIPMVEETLWHLGLRDPGM
jgi:hypothetical protein